jgi:hypothetical protein
MVVYIGRMKCHNSKTLLDLEMKGEKDHNDGHIILWIKWEDVMQWGINWGWGFGFVNVGG